MNVVCLIGNISTDIIYGQGSSTTYCKFQVAVSRQSRNNEADFISCTAFGKTADMIKSYFSKGRKIAIKGRLQVSKFRDQQGNTKINTDVIVDEFYFVDSKPNQNQGHQNNVSPNNLVNSNYSPINF